MMGVNTFIEHALKMQESSFTLKDFSKFLTEMGIPCPKKELRAVLEQSPEVFQLDNGLYITKAGFFSGRLFSICPTAQEYDAGVLVPGDRCMPFVDSELYTSKLQFVIDGTTLPYKQASFDSDTAIDMFMFYGEEYAPQYIADDEANAGCREILLSEGLSNNVSLTGIDISLLKEKYNLKRGGRLLCKVLSRWDGVVEVCVEGDGENRFDLGENGEKRLFWYEVLENAFLEAFEAEGPCECIEAQIVSVFYHNVDALCVPECGSLEEFINRYAKKVGIESYGVETRLWYKGQNPPFVGAWNKNHIETAISQLNRSLTWGQHVPFVLEPDILDLYVLNMLYLKDSAISALPEYIYPSDYVFDRGERESFVADMTRRLETYRKTYNWFADQSVGPLRCKALDLFRSVSFIIYKVDCFRGDMAKIPQQELVILSQLYSHLSQILDMCMDSNSAEAERNLEEIPVMMTSLDGMRYNLEDVEDVLLDALDERCINSFKVVK